MKPTNQVDYLTTGDIAALLGVTLRAVAFAVDDHRLPAPDVTLARGDRLWLASTVASMASHPGFSRIKERAARKVQRKKVAS